MVLNMLYDTNKVYSKREVAKNLKLDGFPFDVISKNTGIPLEEVATL